MIYKDWTRTKNSKHARAIVKQKRANVVTLFALHSLSLSRGNSGELKLAHASIELTTHIIYVRVSRVTIRVLNRQLLKNEFKIFQFQFTK